MPDTEYSWPQPTTNTLQTYSTRMLYYDNAIRTFERRLVMLPPEDARKAAYEQKITVLDTAKARLGGLVDFNTRVVEKQIEKPNIALSWSAERVNEHMEDGLREVEDALSEMRYLMWGM